VSLGGITYPRRYLVADVIAEGVHRGNLIAVAISETGMVMTIELPNGRSLVLTDLPDKEMPDVSPGLDDVRTAIAAHLNRPFEVSDLRWASMYRMHRRMSPKFSQGRCFLVGDAAHTGFAARWADVLTIVDGHSICPPELGGVSAGGAVLIRPDGYVGFQAEKWSPEARSALDELLNVQFGPAMIARFR
jgi:hypothetical protein